MKKMIACLVLLLLMGIFPCLAQLPDKGPLHRPAEKLARKGDKFFKAENYFQALEAYEQALKLDPNNVRALTNGGVANLLLYSNTTALSYLQKAYALNPQFDWQMHYWLGRAYHLTLQPTQAVSEYLEYQKLLPTGNDRQNEIRRLLSEARFLKIYMDNATELIAKNLGSNVNSRACDYSPLLTGDSKSLIFTSRRAQGAMQNKIGSANEFDKMYTSKLFFDGSWSKAEPVDSKSSSKKLHVSNVQLFDNDQQLLVYNSNKAGSLLAAKRDGNVWSEPVAINKYINTSHYEPSGFVNSRDSAIYFSSSKGSKDGSLDLFVSRRGDNGKWGDPQRLSSIINTDQDEDAPFLTKDGMTLYFSSRGHDGMGGYDVYRCQYNPATRSWSRPINLGFPTNSPADDIYFVSNDSTSMGYVSSNRMGTLGWMDIFQVRPLEWVTINGYVTNKANGKPLPGYAVQISARESKKASPTTVITNHDGLYQVKVRSRNHYRVEVLRKGEVVWTDEVEIPLEERENIKIIRDYEIEAPQLPTPPVVQRMAVINMNLVKITYQEYDTLLINGVVTGHTQLLTGAQVQLREETSNTPLYTTITDSQGRYQFGFIPGKKGDYVIEIKQPGYQFASVVVLYSADHLQSKATRVNFKNVNVVDLSTIMVPLDVGATNVLGGVYFNFNGTSLSPKSAITLDRLYTFLADNPTIRMEVGGHADNLGTAYTNRVLSQKRAQQVVDYLVQKGIDKSRLVAKGYGENAPRATNDSEINGRDINRRIEVKIISI